MKELKKSVLSHSIFPPKSQSVKREHKKALYEGLGQLTNAFDLMGLLVHDGLHLEHAGAAIVFALCLPRPRLALGVEETCTVDFHFCNRVHLK